MQQAIAKKTNGHLVRVKPKFQVTIPYHIRERVRLDVGDLVEVEARQNLILIKPKVLRDRASEKEIEAAIAEGLKDVEEGRATGPFETVTEFTDHLHKQVKRKSTSPKFPNS